MGRRKLQGYARKDYMRHRTTKQQRIVNKSIDMLFKGVGSAGKSVAKASRKAAKAGKAKSTPVIEPAVEKERIKLPLSWSIACWAIGFLGFFFATASHDFGGSLGWGILAGVVAYLILRMVKAMQEAAKGFKEGYSSTDTEKDTDIPLENIYSPNPEWAGQMGLVDSRANARVLAPQFLKQAQESAKLLQTTTEPAVFFARYDFCLGRLMQLEECKKYGVSVSTSADLKKYQSLTFRDEAVTEFIHRTEEKYKAKIESLKTAKAKQNWAEKFHQAFEPYLLYMSDASKTALGEASAELYSLAEVSGKKESEE